MGDTGDSGEFVFKTDPSTGGIGYVGDFEGLYRAMRDPWGQSGDHPRMKDYYDYSRQQLVESLMRIDWHRTLEVGCGSGYVVSFINKYQTDRVVHGCDISKTAIARSWSLFPSGFFFQLDITRQDALDRQRWSDLHYDVVVLSQILWYVLEHLPTVFDNCAKLLVPHGRLIVQTAFLDDQKYGRDIVDGWHGLIRWVLDHAPGWQIVSASYDAIDRHAPHHDGILVLRKES